jgi:cysteine desulfurase/selenocysteine lyase
MEHHSNIVPWQILREQIGAKLRVVPINDAGELLVDEYAALLNERTKLVSVAQVSNALGTVNPVKRRLIEMAHARGIPVWSMGRRRSRLPVDVKTSGASSTCSPATSSSRRPVWGSLREDRPAGAHAAVSGRR